MVTESRFKGPLAGRTIVEFAGVGPGPFAAMHLADMGATVISIDRVVPHGLGIKKEARFNPTMRNRPSVGINLKTDAGRDLALRLVAGADALIEGNRPGVMERLGLGPDACRAVNRKLVYGRVTGWGQTGPLADDVGHDLNYLALSGMLSLIGDGNRPAIPLNFLGDYAAGGLYLAMGILAAMIQAGQSGEGQVVDAAMLDGLASLMTHQMGFHASGRWTDERGTNFLDGGAPWYNVYETADGKFVSVAAIEPKFFNELVHAMGLDRSALPDPMAREAWPSERQRFAGIFLGKTRDEWCAIMHGREACFAPVLSLAEAQDHPHARSRGMYQHLDGVTHPAPAPRFSRTPSDLRTPPHEPGADTDTILLAAGVSPADIEALRQCGVISAK